MTRQAKLEAISRVLIDHSTLGMDGSDIALSDLARLILEALGK